MGGLVIGFLTAMREVPRSNHTGESAVYFHHMHRMNSLAMTMSRWQYHKQHSFDT